MKRNKTSLKAVLYIAILGYSSSIFYKKEVFVKFGVSIDLNTRIAFFKSCGYTVQILETFDFKSVSLAEKHLKQLTKRFSMVGDYKSMNLNHQFENCYPVEIFDFDLPQESDPEPKADNYGEVRYLLDKGELSYRQIEKQTGVSISTISRINKEMKS